MVRVIICDLISEIPVHTEMPLACGTGDCGTEFDSRAPFRRPEEERIRDNFVPSTFRDSLFGARHSRCMAEQPIVQPRESVVRSESVVRRQVQPS